MDHRIKLSGVEFFITTVNELLNKNLTIIGNDVKSTIMTLYNSYEMKYSTQRTTAATSFLHFLFQLVMYEVRSLQVVGMQ